MKLSKAFKLNRSQPELDFIDIDPNRDTHLFLDPHFLANRNDRWSQEATRTIRSFFQHLVTLLSTGKNDEAKKTFANLREPNETCLGMSKKKPQGRGVGPEDTNKIFESILHSKAIKSGLVEDLEDCVIFVDNFAKDKLSDMTTNIIRKHLIEYTQDQCNLWNIPLQPSTQSGPFWDRSKNCWDNIHTDMLVFREQRLLLVPKGLVSYSKEYTPQKFHTHFALTFLQGEHLRLNSALVQTHQRKDGSVRTFVTKKSIKESESPGTKEDLNDFVEKHPKIFKDFKQFHNSRSSQSLAHDELANVELADVATHLQEKLKKIPTGNDHASEYHDLIVGILDLLFYPELICPQKEQPIHDGRKRIDITFDNAANSGIFYELSKAIPCQYIFVECKNYKGDPKNPELDQLAGRFSPNRGKVGLLVCRNIDDLELFGKRCNDTYKDDRGLILPVTDSDLETALENVKSEIKLPLSELLRDRKRKIQIK